MKPTKTFTPGRGYSREDWDAVDSPELSDEEMAKARPFAEALPDLTDSIRRRGPPRTKEAISIRLDKEIVARLRATGPGWQSRINDVLREWLDKVA